MIKRSILIALIICSATATPLAAAESDGVISGQIVNSSLEDANGANLEITLEAYTTGANEPAITQSRADAEGNFIFTGLNTSSSYTYFVVASYLGISYYSLAITFATGQTAATAAVAVYETTEGPADISISLSHTIIIADKGGLNISEFFIFYNPGNYTFIGSQKILDGTRITAVLPLLAQAVDIQVDSKNSDYTIFTDQGLAYTEPLIPGYTQVTYAYQLANTKPEYTFNRQVEYVQSIYEILVQGAGQVESPQLVKENPLVIQGTTYDYLTGESVSAGQTITIQLSGLQQDTGREIVIWVLLTLVVLGGAFTLVLRSGRRRTAPISDRGQTQLLAQIAHLDDEFENGGIDEEIYRLKRNELKNQVMKARQQADGRGD